MISCEGKTNVYTSSANSKKLTHQVIVLQAKYKAPNLSTKETDLLLKINTPLAPDKQQCLDELILKRQAENLTRSEHQELIALTTEIEASDAERAAYMAKLAQLCGISLTQLLQEPGLS